MSLVNKNQSKFVKGSQAYQSAKKIEILKKEIKNWKKACYNSSAHTTI